MNTPAPRTGLHPMLWVAAASVTAVSLAGVAKLTGVLPDFGKPAQTETAVVAAPAVPAPAMPERPAATPPLVATAPSPPAVEPSAPRHEAAKPAASTPHPKPAPHRSPPAVAERTPPPADAIPAPPDSPAPAESRASRRVVDAPPPICRDCGVIENIEAIQQKGEGSGIGAVGGAILGGVLGHQVGEGSGKQLARIGGAVLGGLAGNEAERRYRSVSHYQITVRLEDGTRRVIEQTNAPAWRVGDPVRIQNGQIVAGADAPRQNRRSTDF
ncbi:glycine zipper 2TM domain-containing protein [Zoogloea sp.]|uniref:glycine zipper 2TM domain-containing protein n=1 Tax=Zoogloea sp. TaxID=49181 RepID=UPI0035AE6C75